MGAFSPRQRGHPVQPQAARRHTVPRSQCLPRLPPRAVRLPGLRHFARSLRASHIGRSAALAPARARPHPCGLGPLPPGGIEPPGGKSNRFRRRQNLCSVEILLQFQSPWRRAMPRRSVLPGIRNPSKTRNPLSPLYPLSPSSILRDSSSSRTDFWG